MADPVVYLERDGDIAVITFDRPPLNAIDEQLLTELAGAVDDLAADLSVRAVLLRSALDGVFMAGADITEFERIGSEGLDRANAGQEVVNRLAELPQPTVAANNAVVAPMKVTPVGSVLVTTKFDAEDGPAFDTVMV